MAAPSGWSSRAGEWSTATSRTLLRAGSGTRPRENRDVIAKAIKPVYTAPTEGAALARFYELAGVWGAQRS